ncbi:hypothetical protein HPS54_03325 [Prevotella sp. PCHR]|uniref:Cleaved adhesin domain-containing protein n=1 Tax=Xylanibacter caecicola TaxID=2736294 RepID=A0ABX2B384_9BACT|nr:choice-of-anchor J domain-containing protein [Xylanibacter caecicola]NPE24559.1 hypothetical protein [Xylanibacter caecicola]
MKKTLLLLLALVGLVTLQAQVPYQRISTPPTSVKAKQINNKGHESTRAVAKAPKVVVAGIDDVNPDAIEVPFTHGLGKDSNFPDLKTKYTAINANNDNRKWQFGTVSGYGACMVPNAEDINENDDWLITVPVHMPAGDYVVSFELGMMGSGATGVRMDVKLGTSPTVEGMTTQIVPPTVYTEKAMTKYEYNLNIPQEGYYYVGFHCTTEKAMKGTLKLTNVGVRSGSVEPVVPVDPPAAGTLTWVLAPKGELKADVTYVAPTKTKSGADLTEISKVIITSRWEVDKFEYTDVKPGQTIELKDVEMYAGINNRFTAVAYVGETAGDKVEHKNIWCGPDTPLAPENVKLVASEDFKSAVLSWDPVGETGEHGGYVDPNDVTYYIFDAFGSYYDPAIATTKETSLKIEYPDLEGQDFVAYQVTAGYGENYSTDTASDILTIGEPYKMPFAESFRDGRYDDIWLVDPKSNSSNQMQGTVDDEYFPSLIDPEDPDAPAPLVSQDGDNGFFYWLPYEKDVMYGMISPRVDISGAANPALEFWYQGQGSDIDVMVSKDDAPFDVVKTIDMQADPTTGGWTLASIPLTDYKDAKAIQFELRLRAAHNDADHTWSVPLDNIRVRDVVDKDLRMVSLGAPANVKVGDKLTLKAHIENLGKEADGAVVAWTVNGKNVGTSALPVITANGFADAEFEYTVPFDTDALLEIKAEATLEGDGCAVNNAAEASVKVKLNNYPTVTDLAGSAADSGAKVTLTWTAPSLEGLTDCKTVAEDFESEDYTPMSITGAGGWTVYDGDKLKTYNIFRELYNPYQTQPIGFQLFNRTVAEVPEKYWADAAPHSGETFMMAPSSQEGNNDNWLISPELSGNEQTVSFWAKSFTLVWGESFEVLYSTTGNSPEDFTQTVEVENYPADGVVPEDWTEFKVALPKGAKHFAIRHKTYDTVALLVDDVTYESAPDVPTDIALTGYYIFRDGERINEVPVTETTYTDSPVEAGAADGEYTYSYVVVPVYNYGTAPKSNEVTVSVVSTAIDEITEGGAGSVAVYYNLQGVRVPAGRLVPGVYVRVTDGHSDKVVVK